MNKIKRHKKAINRIFSENGIEILKLFPEQIASKYLIPEKDLLKDDIRYIEIYEDGSYELIHNPKKTNDKKTAYYFYDLTYPLTKAILSKKPEAKDISKEINQLRIIKDSDEIESIKKACKISKKILEEIELNKSEKELSKEIKIKSIAYGEGWAFDPIVAYNTNTKSIHHIPKNTNPSSKNIVLLDIGVKYKEYNSDITQTLIFSEKYKQPYEVLQNTLEMLEDEAKDGTSIQNLINITKNQLKEYEKYAYYHKHLLGHGVGLEVHELPNFSENTILKKNMVITLEPAIYTKNYGIRLEKTYLIRKNKKAKSLC